MWKIIRTFSEIFIIETIYHNCFKTFMPLMLSFDSYNIIKISTEYIFICSYCSSSYCLISIILILQYFACSLLLGILNNNHIYIFHSGIWLIYFIAIFFNKKKFILSKFWSMMYEIANSYSLAKCKYEVWVWDFHFILLLLIFYTFLFRTFVHPWSCIIV